MLSQNKSSRVYFKVGDYIHHMDVEINDDLNPKKFREQLAKRIKEIYGIESSPEIDNFFNSKYFRIICLGKQLQDNDELNKLKDLLSDANDIRHPFNVNVGLGKIIKNEPLSPKDIWIPHPRRILETLDNKSVTMDISKHYRIWFSNNPEQLLPPLHQVTLEESIKSYARKLCTAVN